MEKTPQGVYSFNHILGKAFSLGDNDEDVEVTILNKKGKKPNKKVYAAVHKKIYLEKVPDFLLLSLNRSLPGNKKINNNTEGLDPEITLS